MLGSKKNGMKRVKSGIKDFDKLLNGGIPDKSLVLLSGGPGVGKSIFALEFCTNGAKLYREKALYISLEQSEKCVIQQGTQLGFGASTLEKKGVLKVIAKRPSEISSEFITETGKIIKKHNIKRVVIDSLTALSISSPAFKELGSMGVANLLSDSTVISPPVVGDTMIKLAIYDILYDIRSWNTTTLLISQPEEESGTLSRDGVSEFFSDGVIQFIFEPIGGEYSRHIVIRKMRMTKISDEPQPYLIEKGGIKLV
ncbi:MAG TPA: hypothetical protein ENN46_01290 [Candidatus Woesearchaeota archaeon]|nr:hypothetical protein [Candidatus Woesearchaeota archaeon]